MSGFDRSEITDIVNLRQQGRTHDQMRGHLRVCLTEIDRLIACLKKANGQTEHFEREWYLRGNEVERLERELREAKEEFARLDAPRRRAELKRREMCPDCRAEVGTCDCEETPCTDLEIEECGCFGYCKRLQSIKEETN